MIITRLEPQKRRPGRYSLFVDEVFALGLSAEVVARLGLAQGQVLTPERLEELRREEQYSRIREKAFRLLSRRAHGTAELRRKLLRQDFPVEEIEPVLRELEQRGWLDDRRFALELIQERLRLRPLGPRGLRAELVRRGLPREMAEAVLGEVGLTAEQEEALALEVARRRLPALSGLDPRSRRRRLYGYLARRGFGPEAIRKVLIRLSRP